MRIIFNASWSPHALYVLVASLLSPRSQQAADSFALPESAAYHDEDVAAVKNFRPWVVAGVVAILISYVPPLVQVLGGNYGGAG